MSVLVVVAQLWTVPLTAQQPNVGQKPPFLPTSHFAARSVIRDAELSPDGKTITFFRDGNLQTEFIVADPATGQTLRQFLLPEGFNVLSYQWAGNDRVLISALGMVRRDRYRYFLRRLFVASPRTGEVRRVIEDPFLATDANILHVAKDGTWAVIAHPHAEKETYPSVYRYDLTTGQQSAYVQPLIEGVSNWYTDDQGTVRLGIGRVKDQTEIWYRSSAQDRLTLVDRFPNDQRARRFTPVFIEAGSDLGYAFKRNGDHRQALHRFDFGNRSVVSTMAENPDWDITGAWLKDGELLGASYMDDVRRRVWFDPTMRSLYTEIKAALGGDAIQLSFNSVSDDDQRMLLWAGNASDPGVLYFLDRSTMAMRELAQLRPGLDFRQLVAPKPITYTARDGVKIAGYLTLPRGREPVGLPLIIHPHGGPYGVRDSLRYNDEVQFLANRGYAVLQPNFRGSGGYGDAFFDLGEGEIGRGMQDDLDDAMDWAVSEGIVDPQRVCVIGGSYGGYAAMWSVLRNPERYRCAASWAGVTDWDRQLKHDRRFLTRYDRRQFRDKVRGDEAFRLSSVSPARLGSQLNRPLLLAHGTRDGIVLFSQFEEMQKATRKAPTPPTTLIVHAAGHSFTRERDQQLWFDALDQFLAEHNPADQIDENGVFTPERDDAMDGFFTPLNIGSSVNDKVD